MLLLTIILSAVYLGLRIATIRKFQRFKILTAQVMGFVVVVFGVVCLLRDPFERLATVAVEGIGLNPQLQSVWMAIHPPIVFSAYVFVVLAFALTLASLKTGRELESVKLFKVSTFLSWILLTIGIALGGVWAYAVLGWGGYWAWDPVETASLLPWLLLTGYFIVKHISKTKTSLTQESMIMLVFASLVFLSALTRGGLTQSVHSYATSAIGPIMLSFAVAMMGYFFYAARGTRKRFFRLEVNRGSLSSRSSFVAFWALILISIVCLGGLAFPGFAYSYWTYPFVVLFAAAMVGFSLKARMHYARQFLIVTFALIVGVVFSVIGFGVNLLVPLTAPLLVVALGALVYRALIGVRQRSLLWQVLFGIAVIVMLLGVFFSAGAKTSTTLENIQVNSIKEVGQITVEVSNLYLSNSTSNVYNTQAGKVIPEFSVVTVDATIHSSSLVYNGELSAAFYPNYGLVVEPVIISTVSGDVYIHLEVTEELYDALSGQLSGDNVAVDNVSVTVQENPLVYLVWVGVFLMLVALTYEFAVDVRSAANRTALLSAYPKVM